MTDHDPLCPVDPQLVHLVGDHCFWCEVIAKVRAEEQVKAYAFATRMVLRRGEYLRAKLEALSRAPLSPLDWVLRADVLALLDGGSDE